MPRIKLFAISLLLAFRSLAQIQKNTSISYQIEDSLLNSKIYNLESSKDFLITKYKKPSKEKCIIFFCSTTQDDRSVYFQNSLLFLKKKLTQYNSHNIYIYLFNGEIINHCITLNFPDTSLMFSDFRCYFINYDSTLIYHTLTKEALAQQFKIDKVKSRSDIHQITLVKSTCGGSNFSKVFEEYSPFIHEVLNPTYSDHEWINKLREEIRLLREENIQIKSQLDGLRGKIEINYTDINAICPDVELILRNLHDASGGNKRIRSK